MHFQSCGAPIFFGLFVFPAMTYLFLVLKTDLLTSPYNQDSLCQPAGSCISLQAQGEAEEVADMGEALGKPELFVVHWERGRYIFTYCKVFALLSKVNLSCFQPAKTY